MNENSLSMPRKTRAAAGKALVVFLALMGVLTLASNTLQEMSVAVVSVVTPQRGSLERMVNAEGNLVAGETIPVYAEDAVRVSDVYVKSGASVNKGDPLFKLDTEALSEQYNVGLAELNKAKNSREKAYTDYLKNKFDAVRSAKDTLAARQLDFDWAEADASTWELKNLADTEESVAQAETAYIEAQNSNESESNIKKAKDKYDTEKRKLDRLTNMRNYITKRDDLAKAKTDLSLVQREYRDMLKLAESAIDSGEVTDSMKGIRLDLLSQDTDITEKEAELAELEAKIVENGIVYAPVSGDVVSVNIESGATAATNSAAVTLSNKNAGMSLIVTVTEDQAGDMAVGEIADITVNSRGYQSSIVSIAPSSTSQGMYDIGFELPGDVGVVGMKASMKFTKRTQNYDLLIPVSALRQDNDGYYVYVLTTREGALGSQMSAERADIYIYEKDSTRVAVQAGVSMRDQLISRGDREINDGDRVRLEN